MEVKFENESNIYRMVLSVVRKTLAAHDLIPSLSMQEESATTHFDTTLQFNKKPWNNLTGSPDTPVFSLKPNMRGDEIPSGSVPNIIGHDSITPFLPMNLCK